jgi:hypothetical protein
VGWLDSFSVLEKVEIRATLIWSVEGESQPDLFGLLSRHSCEKCTLHMGKTEMFERQIHVNSKRIQNSIHVQPIQVIARDKFVIFWI